MIVGMLRIQSKRENIDLKIKRSSIFFVNKIWNIPCQATSLEIETQSDQQFSLKNLQLKIKAP